MKKVLFFCLTAIYLLTALSVHAADEDRDIFVKTRPIIKILTHELGYRILYYKTGMGVGVFNVPYGWFNKSDGPANIFWGKEPAFPYFSIYWRDGKFDHLKIYVKEDQNDASWGVLNLSRASVKEDFEVTPDTFMIEF